MAADHLFINATDATIADVTASTATTAAVAARSVSAASSTSADVASYLNAADSRAVMATGATSAQKIAVAFTLLKSAGIDLGPLLPTVTELADPVARDKFRIKAGQQEGLNLVRAIQ